ncbi:conserved hypothetical protein [Nitrosotalea sinensis]|uniref:DUF1512 domain-containing protein n=1 Tax=Nitrosotalea sinensis TaxID=1499975 RepID=A0A2H1EJ03_9ARCH|nr:DUF1512 domain-containing protein [Candidatus Nitrosotalea sinensis]SHO47650.1 conserved hypothetical protein [Candidatus Nitrosotalea sinensis]
MVFLLLDFLGTNLDKLFSSSDNSNPLMWLIWILPIFIFMLYGQRIQLHVTSSEINKDLEKLKQYRDDTRKELISYVKNTVKPLSDPAVILDRYFEYFTIMPVDMDPNGIVPKIKHIMRTREDTTREQVKNLAPNITHLQASQIINILEAVTTLHLLYKMVRHFFLTAKKQNNFPLILPLQMMMPFIMEEADALKTAISAFKQGQPIGDGIGPMIVGKMMLDTEKKSISFETVLSEKDFEGRKLCLLKAEGPTATVGRPADAFEKIISEKKVDMLIMVDAALKLEGEDTGSVAHGFGAAIGGIGTERFEIEGIATKHNIPIYAIVIKQSIKEAITLMKKEIADSSDKVFIQIQDIIRENSKPGQCVLIIGVGNTLGVSQ